MKKLLFIAVAAMFAMCANAQKFGITAGLNVSSWTDEDCDSHVADNIGVKLEADAEEGFYYEGSALFTEKGVDYKYKVKTPILDGIEVMKAYYPIP